MDIDSDAERDQTSLRRRCVCGFLLALLSLSGPVCGTTFSQLLQGYIPIFQLTALRFLVQIVVVVGVMLGTKTHLVLTRAALAWMMITAISRWAANIALFEAAVHMPAGTMHSVDNSAGILVGTITGVVVSRKCKLLPWIPVFICLAGLLLVAQPAILGFSHDEVVHGDYVSPCYGDHNQTSGSASNTSSIEGKVQSDTNIYGYALAIFAGAARAMGYVIIFHKLPHVDGWNISLWQGIVGLLLSAAPMTFIETLQWPSNASCLGFLLAMIIPTGVGAVIINLASLLIAPGPLTIIMTGEIVVTGVLQYTLLSNIHPGYGNAMEVCGLVLVMAGNLFSAGKAYLETRNKHEEEVILLAPRDK